MNGLGVDSINWSFRSCMSLHEFRFSFYHFAHVQVCGIGSFMGIATFLRLGSILLMDHKESPSQ